MSTRAGHSTVCTSPAELKRFLLETLPQQGQWSEEEYLWLTDRTTRLVEFTDGQIEVLPMPTFEHQLILRLLFKLFDSYIEPRGGLVLFAALRLRIRARRYREPDLLLVRDSRDPRCQNRYWLGADLVVEVVSEDKPERDLIEKVVDYAEAGVPEYWIVNPLDQTITVLRLAGREYATHGVFKRGERAISALLDGFGVDVSAVFDAAPKPSA